jgi:hypothetical protein
MSGMYLQGYWCRIQSWSDGEETAKVQNTVVELERRQGATARFMMEIRNEGFPDLALAGEELLQSEPRGLATRTTGTQGNSFWGLKASFWTSISSNDQEGDGKNQARAVDALEAPIGSWLTRLEEFEWWISTATRMTRHTEVARPAVISWNIGPIHWIFSREWIRKVASKGAPIILLQEVRLPPGSHRTVKGCLSQICPDYDVWMEEGRETKGMLQDR